MALLDMGAEYHFYGSDITCSFPVSMGSPYTLHAIADVLIYIYAKLNIKQCVEFCV